jgi:integrase
LVIPDFTYSILAELEINTMASFRKRGKTWTYYVYYKDNNGDKQQLNHGGYPTKKMAQLAAAEIEQQYRHGADLTAHKISLISYWDKWIKLYKAGKNAPITERRYSTIRKQLVAHFGEDTQLNNICKNDWQEFLNEFGADRTKDTVSKLNGYVRAMAESAVADRIIYSNFTKGTVLTGLNGKPRELKYLQLDDFAKLIKYCTKHARLRSVYNYMIITGALTGARFSEVAALQWPDIDWDTDTIHITKSWDYTYGGGFKATKTPSSVRDISMPPELATILKQLQTAQQERSLATGYRDPKHMVFRNIRHEVPGDSAINKALHQVEDDLGITPRITFHGLRHTHVSYLLSQGVDIYYISQRLGHSNIEITMRVYSHLLDQARKSQDTKALTALSTLAGS